MASAGLLSTNARLAIQTLAGLPRANACRFTGGADWLQGSEAARLQPALRNVNLPGTSASSPSACVTSAPYLSCPQRPNTDRLF